MNICLLSYRANPYCGGQGVYLYYLSKVLAERGHKVIAIVGPPYPEPMPWANLIRLDNHNFINKPGRSAIPQENPLSVFSPRNFAEFSLSRLGSNPEMFFFSLRAFQMIRSLLKEGEKIDLVHDNQSLGYGLLLIKRMGLPVLATVHHPLQVDRAEDLRQMWELGKRFRRALYYPLLMQKFVARQLEKLVTVSDASKKLISKSYGIPEEKIEVIPNGVDLNFFRPEPAIKKVPGRLLFVGSSEDRKKGIIFLLRALKQIPDPKVHLVIVDGRLRPERIYAKSLVEKMGLKARVSFREKITREELKIEYNKAEVVVVPSLFEGFGLPALEAMASGSALIASRAGALDAVVGEGEAGGGILVPAGDVEELKRALLGLLKDSKLKARLEEAGRKRAELFGWERVGERMERVYEELIRRARDEKARKGLRG